MAEAPLTEEEKAQLAQLLGGSAQQTTPPAPGTLPPGIPVGQPYVSGFSGGRPRITVPPPASEVQRQIAVERMKQENKVKTPKVLSA